MDEEDGRIGRGYTPLGYVENQWQEKVGNVCRK